MHHHNQSAVHWPDADRPLHWWVDAQCQRSPEAVALRFEGHSLTYGQLQRASDALAAQLMHSGVPIGAVVGVAMPRSIELVVALLAVLKAGAAYIPLDLDWPEARLAAMVQDMAPAAVLTLAFDAPWPWAHGATAVDLPRLLLGPDEPFVPPEVSADSPAYAIFTSGSTGAPKAAVNSHRGVVNRLLWMQSAYPISSSDVVLQKTPFTFDVSVWEFFWPLMEGAVLEIARPGGHLDMAYLQGLMDSARVTVVHFVPTMLRLFMSFIPEGWRPGLRFLICSGEQLPLDLMKQVLAQWPDTGLHNLYGPAECAVDVSAWDCRAHAEMDRVLIGVPVANTRLHVLDPERRPVPPGQPGELWIAGVQVGVGYLHRPDLTAERFWPDAFPSSEVGALGSHMYRTGDLVRWHGDAGLEYLGRIDFQVKLGGVRIELGEIEAQLLADSAVQDAVVLMRGDKGFEHLVAVVVPSDPAVLQSAAAQASWAKLLLDALAQRLPAIMVPARGVAIDAMPLTSSGKTDRRALAAWLEQRLSVLSGPSDPAGWPDVWHDMVARAWAAHLPVAPDRVDQDFFAQGGSSLLALKVAAELGRMSGRQVSPGWLYRHPSLAAQAKALSLCAVRAAETLQAPVANGALALSPQQQMLLLAGAMDASGAAMLVHVPLLLDPGCDVLQLRRGFEWLLQRHPVLRTQVHLDGETWRPETLPCMPDSWWREAGEIDRLPNGLDWPDHLSEDMCRTLGSESVQPCRVDVWRAPHGHLLLIWTVHHFAIDEAATDLCLSELDAWLKGLSLPEAPPAGGLCAYEHAHTDLAGVRRLALAVSEGLSASARPPFESNLGASRDVLLTWRDDVKAGLLHVLATQPHVVFPTLMTAFGRALQQVYGGDAKYVLTPCSRRVDPAQACEVGYGLDVRLIHAGRMAQEAPQAHLERVRLELIDAMEPVFTPLHLVTQELGGMHMDAARMLGAFCLTWRQFPQRRVSLGALGAQLLLYPHRGSKFGLTLHAARLDDGLHAYIEAVNSAHDDGTVARVANAFEEALADLLALPAQSVQSAPRPAARGALPAEPSPGMKDAERSVHPLVAQAWRAVLGQSAEAEVWSHAHFFVAGGTSLGVIKLAAEVRRLSGRSFQVAAFMREPTAGRLEALLDLTGPAENTPRHDVEDLLLRVGAVENQRVLILLPGYLGFALGMKALAESIVALSEPGLAVLIPDLVGIVEQLPPEACEQPQAMAQAVLARLHQLLDGVPADAMVGIAGYSLGGQLAIEWCKDHASRTPLPVALLDTYPPKAWSGGGGAGLLRTIGRRFWRWWDAPSGRAPLAEHDAMLDLAKPANRLIPDSVRQRWKVLDAGLSSMGQRATNLDIHLVQAGLSLWYVGLWWRRGTNGFVPRNFRSITSYRLPVEHLEMPKRGRHLVAGVIAEMLRKR